MRVSVVNPCAYAHAHMVLGTLVHSQTYTFQVQNTEATHAAMAVGSRAACTKTDNYDRVHCAIPTLSCTFKMPMFMPVGCCVAWSARMLASVNMNPCVRDGMDTLYVEFFCCNTNRETWHFTLALRITACSPKPYATVQYNVSWRSCSGMPAPWRWAQDC